jgi:hypothetical protein
MRRYVGFGAFVLASLTAITGCKHQSQIVTIVTPDLNALQAAKEGDILTWRAMKSGGKEFTVHFIGVGPCGANTTHLTSLKWVASCKVVKSTGNGQVYYQYFIDYNPTDQPQLLDGPRSCSGCLIEQDPTADFVAPAAASPSPQTETSEPHNAVSGPPDGKVQVGCDSTKTPPITAQGPANPTTSIYWLADATAKGWVVTFPYPATTTLCIEGSQFEDDNNVCTLSQPLTQSYNFSIKTDNCPNSQSFPVPATP